MAWQQFSTPIDGGGVATLLAAPKPDDIVFEPSAGNGLFVAQLGTFAALHLNEIDGDRRGRCVQTLLLGHRCATLDLTTLPML